MPMYTLLRIQKTEKSRKRKRTRQKVFFFFFFGQPTTQKIVEMVIRGKKTWHIPMSISVS